MSNFCLVFAIGALFSASIAFHWAPLPKDGDVIYACKGDDVTFPWAYSLAPGEEIYSIEWLFDGFSQEMIAMVSNGVFLPLAAFSGRVQQAANVGIVLSHVIPRDSGNYTVEVNVIGLSVVFRHTVILHVNNDLPTSDGQLHVQQEPDAVLDSNTQQWSLVLSCGIFIYLAEPVFPVEWLIPSGRILASTNYKDGYFHLHLANPIEDGSYTCRVPQQHVASACLHSNQNEKAQASVVVDRMEARMTLMEAEVRSLRHDKLQLEQQVTVLQKDLTQKVDSIQENLTKQAASQSNLTQKVDIIQNNLAQQAVSLDTKMSLELGQLMTNVTHMIQDAVKTPLIGFNAQSTVDQVLHSPTHVKFNTVLYNAGQGYDSSTGDFTAPLSGAYFFTFQTQSYDSHGADSYMKVNGQEVCIAYIYNNYDHGSCNAVVHLTEGDKAWIEPYGRNDRYYFQYTTSFAGFLFYADP